MNKQIALVAIALLSFLTASVVAQTKKLNDNNNSSIIDQRIENITEQTENENIDYTNLIDALQFYLEHPINLNTATKQALEDLGLLTEIQINNLLYHIDKNGSLVVIQELQTIEGFDMPTIQRILPYVYVSDNFNEPHVTFKEILTKGQHTLFLRSTYTLEQQQGFAPITDSALKANPNSRFLGDPLKNYIRYRFNYGTNVSLGFTGEKDPGEEFFKGSQKQGFDFYSAHLCIRNFGNLKALCIGDYQAQFGQGVVFSTGIAFGKTADVLAVKRNYSGIRPYTSVNENIFLRGAAATYQLFKHIDATVFASSKKIDASVNSTGSVDSSILNGNITRDDVVASSLQLSGFHRTPNELLGKNAIQENVYGTNINYHTRRLRIGFTYAGLNYSSALIKTPSAYNQFAFGGKNNSVMGLEYNYVWRNFNLYGETGRSANGGLATLNGALISLDPRVTMSIIYRNYQRNYQQLGMFANAFGEGTTINNEKGLYMGLNIRPISTLSISTFYDRFEFPWLRYLNSTPNTAGQDFFLQANYMPSKKVSMYGRYRTRNKMRNTSADINDIDFIINYNQQNYRYEVSYAVSPSVKLKNRIEFVNYKTSEKAAETGVLFYQDLTYNQLGKPFSVSLRYALFDTKSWNTRIYGYETDVLYSFTVPAYYGKGARAYVVFNYTVNKHIDIWLRAAQFYYLDQTTIGSGLSTINGDTKTDIRAQIRFRF